MRRLRTIALSASKARATRSRGMTTRLPTSVPIPSTPATATSQAESASRLRLTTTATASSAAAVAMTTPASIVSILRASALQSEVMPATLARQRSGVDGRGCAQRALDPHARLLEVRAGHGVRPAFERRGDAGGDLAEVEAR